MSTYLYKAHFFILQFTRQDKREVCDLCLPPRVKGVRYGLDVLFFPVIHFNSKEAYVFITLALNN